MVAKQTVLIDPVHLSVHHIPLRIFIIFSSQHSPLLPLPPTLPTSSVSYPLPKSLNFTFGVAVMRGFDYPSTSRVVQLSRNVCCYEPY